jgi:hypothetical protein
VLSAEALGESFGQPCGIRHISTQTLPRWPIPQGQPGVQQSVRTSAEKRKKRKGQKTFR